MKLGEILVLKQQLLFHILFLLLLEISQVNHPPGQVDRTAKRRPQLAHEERGAKWQQRGAVNEKPAPLRCERGEDRNQRSPLPKEPNAKRFDRSGLICPSSTEFYFFFFFFPQNMDTSVYSCVNPEFSCPGQSAC
ncbi:hypothetical protein LDENG_00271260 [Lucifuga dentata]|nr:hypothetical protein LDENG_00271260 [Lucifuga dentata]